ncbi:hypothetical protein Moror_13851 [Moniliophthora roreri MCA 2997]|uniref:NAD(P)-binding domain-containing protein n=1 Tax=Moniliophthora roreri (strain MCA 2997) TaxID=1381753 RepID=V2YU04_MONRO|nr:hypothetical protein Moror_13851 [Moniliophthora roreri MCA 2997]
MNVFSIGAARNIGYYSSIRLLDAGCTVTFLLRTPSVFDGDEVINKYVASGKVTLVKGDALTKSDVERGWAEAAKYGKVDLLLFTVGGTPHFSFRKGFIVEPHDLVTRCMLNALCTIPKDSPLPKVVTVTSTGLTRSSHAALPMLLKPLYAYLLAVPHHDKIGVERLLHHCAGWSWKEAKANADHVLGANWLETPGLPERGSLEGVLIVRGAMFTDGESMAESKGKKKGYRVTDSELPGAWTISRKDVAHFIVDALLNKWDQYGSKCISIAY